MYTEYAKDPRMKINLGIRRRLAPLLDNGRDEIQLMTAILFSLPGSPVLYYGDEIAMGDNIFLGDRDGVRTPMQWTVDRNGGFSRADFAQLYAPPLMDPVYGFQAVNVEAQLRTPTSLLRWMHRFIALRKEHPVFGLGTYEPIETSNPRIFAVLRRFEDDLVLCVHNLARSAQAVELDLSAHAGRSPVELFGRSRFPRIGELNYLLTLAPRGFYWFQLVQEGEDGDRMTDVQQPGTSRDRASGSGRGVGVAGGPALVRVQVAPRHRAAGGGERGHRRRTRRCIINLVQARFASGSHELYQLPFALLAADQVGDRPVVVRHRGLDRGRRGRRPGARARAAAPDRRRADGRGRGRHLPLPARGAERPAAARRAGAPDGRRAVQLVDRVRRRDGAQGLPAPGAGHQSRARGAAVPHPPGVRQHRPAAGVVRVRGQVLRRHAGRGPALLPRGRRRLGARAGPDRHRSGGLPARARQPRRGHRAAAQRAGLRLRRPGLQPRGAQRRVDVAAHGDDRRGHRARLRAPARRRAGRRHRRPRPGRARADRHARPDRGRADAPSAPTATTTSARPCTCRGLAHHRLRGRAGPPAVRAPPEAQPAARRGRDAALAGLRHLGHGDHARGAGARPVRGTGAQHLPASTTSPRSIPALLPGGEAAIRNTLAIFELEKAIYELQYELDNRPDWLPIPVAGIARLLETA